MNNVTLELETILVIARPGRFRDGLQAVLQALPWVDSVMCQNSVTAVPPIPFTLTILDADIMDARNWPNLLERRAVRGQAGLIVLISTSQQRSLAAALGADATLLKGFATETLYRTLEALVHPQAGVR